MRKRSHLLETAILGLLADQDLHGYELKRRLVDVLGLFSSVSFGSMYPALARLEGDGAVRAGGSPPAMPSIPLTGSLGGERAVLRAQRSLARPEGRGARGKKVYSIAEEGRDRFRTFLASEPDSLDDEAAFKLRLAFARHLSADARLGLLEQRRAYLVGLLARSRSSVSAREGLDPYAQSIVDHSTSVTENDISWLDHMIRNERSHTP